MVKFTSARGNQIVVGLGISDGDLAGLKNGQPIVVKLQELGISNPLEIVIFHGKTDQELYEQLKPRIGPQTTVHQD